MIETSEPVTNSLLFNADEKSLAVELKLESRDRRIKRSEEISEVLAKKVDEMEAQQ